MAKKHTFRITINTNSMQKFYLVSAYSPAHAERRLIEEYKEDVISTVECTEMDQIKIHFNDIFFIGGYYLQKDSIFTKVTY